MTTIKYLKAVLKYVDEDVYVELDARVLHANKDCDVSAVYTYDEWRTTRSKNGTFLKTVTPDESLYRISIFVSNIPRNSRIWFALKLVDHKYEHNFWDNNEGINYEIIPEKLPQICLPSKETDTPKPCRTQISPALTAPQDSLPQTKPQKSASRPSSRHSSPSSSPTSSRTSSPISSPPSSPLSSQSPSPPFPRPPSPPHTSTPKNQHTQSPTPRNLTSRAPSSCTRFSQQSPSTSHSQISPHSQPFVPQPKQVTPPQYQFTNYQQPSAPHTSTPKFHYQSQNPQQPQPQSTLRSPISPNKSSTPSTPFIPFFTPQTPQPANRSFSYPSPSFNLPQSTQSTNKSPSSQSQSLKTLTPQQLYFLQYTFPRPETRKSPPKQKPTSSHVFIPSDLFPNHSICSLMQGHNRIYYDEFIC